ncbi:MAG: hypothetical protein AB7U97_25165 [Pirellulales bacterium]
MRCAFLVAFAVAALVTAQASANLLANPSFEQPITMDGAPFVGFWEGFSGGAGASSANGNSMPRTGIQELDLGIDGIDNSFAGAFQDVPGLIPGTPVVFSGYHKKGTDPADVGIEIRIEWRNTGANTEISRTPNLTVAPGSDYVPFALPSVVPAGADTARVVYAIQTFGGEPGPTNTGLVYVDDVSLVVPEPMSIALCGLSSLALLFVRRR